MRAKSEPRRLPASSGARSARVARAHAPPTAEETDAAPDYAAGPLVSAAVWLPSRGSPSLVIAEAQRHHGLRRGPCHLLRAVAAAPAARGADRDRLQDQHSGDRGDGLPAQPPDGGADLLHGLSRRNG